MEQETGEGEEVESSPGRGQTFRVARQAAKATRPGEVALHHPLPGQEDDAAVGLGQLDHRQLDPVFCRGRSWLFTGVAVVTPEW
jgi:hypothetical protein